MAFLNNIIKKMLNEEKNIESVLDRSHIAYTEEEIAEAEKIFSDLENDSNEVVNIIKNKTIETVNNDVAIEDKENNQLSKKEMIGFIKDKIRDIEHFNRLFQVFNDCKADLTELQNSSTAKETEEIERKNSFWDEL